MNSTTILRRVAGARLARRAFSARNSYSTSSSSHDTQEPDPQLNDYPQLPWVSRQHLPPKGWHDQLQRRNFGDTLHEQEEVLSMWGPDVAPVPPSTALRQFATAFVGFITFGFVVKYYLTPEAPAVPREYPYSGLVKELGGLEENKARPESTEED